MNDNCQVRPGAALSWARARAACLAVGALAAGCGGGGGGSSPPPPPPSPTTAITLTADATSVAAGSAPVAVHLTIGDASVPTWRLEGPGSLVPGTHGEWMDYVPPDTEAIDAAASAKLVVTAGDNAKSITFALSPVSLPGHAWTLANATPHWLAVAPIGNTLVAAASSGELWQSVDGANWSTRQPVLRGALSLATDGTRWLAVDSVGDVASTTDGSTWTTGAPVTLGGLPSLAWGNGAWVIADGSPRTGAASLVSTDGATWTSAGSASAANAVAFGQGRFVGVGQDGVVTSTDGAAWSAVAGSPVALTNIAFGNGLFVATTNDYPVYPFRAIATSPDGLNWTTTTTSDLFAGNIWGLSFAHGLFFLEGGNGTYTSSDGQAWAFVPRAAGTEGMASVTWGAGRYVGVTETGAIVDSADGVAWLDVVDEGPGHLMAVDTVGGVTIAASDQGWSLRSTDLKNWARVQVGSATDNLATAGMAHGGGVRVAVGGVPVSLGNDSSGRIFVSDDDGLTWVTATVPPANTFVSVAFDGQRFVALDLAGAVFASTGGHAWSTLAQLPVGGNFVGAITFGGGTYVAASAGALFSSPDAVNWTLSAPGVSGPLFDSLAYDGTRFVAVGSVATGGVCATSTDGHTWLPSALPSAPRAVATANGIIVVTNGAGITTSVDGAHWGIRQPAVGAHEALNALAFTGDTFVGVGNNGEIVLSSQ